MTSYRMRVVHPVPADTSLDGFGEQEVEGLNFPTGVPLRYRLDGDLRPVLDPDAASVGIAEGVAQGRE